MIFLYFTKALAYYNAVTVNFKVKGLSPEFSKMRRFSFCFHSAQCFSTALEQKTIAMMD
jgi:hypothetical protein